MAINIKSGSCNHRDYPRLAMMMAHQKDIDVIERTSFSSTNNSRHVCNDNSITNIVPPLMITVMTRLYPVATLFPYTKQQARLMTNDDDGDIQKAALVVAMITTTKKSQQLRQVIFPPNV